MYSEIEIHKTEYVEKYLLMSNNSTLYVGFLVKDIVNLLKEEFTIDVIVKKINDEHNIQLNNQDVSNVKMTIDDFLKKKEQSNLYKVVNFFNPSEIPIPKSVLNIFSTKDFYIKFLFFLIVNCFALIYSNSKNQSNSFYDNVIIAATIFLVLFFHELGHSFSAKKLNVKVKEIGFGFYYFFPVLYVNLNESWKLKKEKRTIINLSGIYTQLIIGFLLAVFIYSFGENKLLTSIFKINFYIILLNLNPFLKFDGYWIVSDLLEENNLLKTSNSFIKEKFKLKTSTKFKSWIILYTILRILFIAYIVFFIIKRIVVIVTKYIEQVKLSSDENIFILIMSLYLFRIIFTKLKK